LLTNPENGAPDEDRLLKSFLSQSADVVAVHPLECLPFLCGDNLVLIRNAWPTHLYPKEWNSIEQTIQRLNLTCFNPLVGKGDQRGKEYLLELWDKEFPVIPSVRRIEDIHRLPISDFYWIKPLDGCDGSGSKKVAKGALEDEDLTDYIIQPFVQFSEEPSFFFIDNVFSHAITMPNRLLDKDIKEYTPSGSDLAFAASFVKWNGLPYGVQRVDAIRMASGELLLTEVEDLCPYLYLSDVNKKTQSRFLEKIQASIFRAWRHEPFAVTTQ